ncbi:SDR family NAD(P)-dependent oxidoreductase [Paenibacillus sp. 481]|uniref:SDR family NAD(P)-dependent oxidoreductase n=1 Tax=Paenibacillus sp. 481 TaxID=2835869 RepID=UPI001E557FA8|nr:SDR family NAD(P)-dependent oxidoreductase [Paenibacillus sp. 481]UHA72039.1 SDR family NAD(P)-dependent oxidoreductase [Paenibacillus sp. 481]
MDLKNKVVLITGASTGIGAEAARLMVNKGAKVIMTARSVQKLQDLADRLGPNAFFYPLDVSNGTEVNDVIQKVIHDHGRIDVLVNNAGTIQCGHFVDLPLESFEQMMDVNYFGTVRCLKAVVPHMIHNKSGHIVNVASMAGKFGQGTFSAYSPSKHALLGLTNSLRQELQGTGIHFTAINPTFVNTAFVDQADPTGGLKRKNNSKMLQPVDVANKIVLAVERNIREIDLPFLMTMSGKLLFHLFPKWFDKFSISGPENK